MGNFTFPPNPAIYPSLLPFKFTVSFFANQSHKYIHICIYVFVKYIIYLLSIHIYIYIHKYNLFSLCKVNHMCVFRAAHFMLARQLVRSSLGETISPARSLQFPAQSPQV